jgi:acetate---CoA ligase (ADP-forming) subunit alpha
VIGASRKPGKIGYEIVRNIKIGGFAGKIIPINPHGGTILGFQTYPSVKSFEGEIDLAVIVLPAELTIEAAKDCGEKGVRACIVISSGFSEAGHPELEERLIETVKSQSMRLIGPNTFGIYFADNQMNATFGPSHVLPGRTAFISQSGALGLALMDWTTEEKYGVSSIVSIGNKADVDDADLLEFFEQDVSTQLILVYMEGLKNGRKFYNVSRRVSKKKPIIVIKAGTSKRGAVAASSHTGSVAGADSVFNAAFEEAGILRAKSMTQAFDWIQALNENPVPDGEGIVVVTNGGGIGVLTTDYCETLGLKLMDLPQELKAELAKIAPSFGSLKNPIDLTANADDVIYGSVIRKLLARNDVDAIIILFCQTANIDPMLVAHALLEAKKNAQAPKPMTAALIGGHLAEQGYSRLLEKKFAAYPTSERAVDGMFALITRSRQLAKSR